MKKTAPNLFLLSPLVVWAATAAAAEPANGKSNDLAELSDVVREITGRVEELEKSVSEIKERLLPLEKSKIGGKSLSPEETAAVVRKAPEEVVAIAAEMIDEGATDKARNLLEAFIKRNPTGIYCGMMLFYIGNCYFLEKDYENAAVEYMKGFKTNPNGSRAAETLYKLALCFEKLHENANCKLTLERIRDDYPGEFAKKALQKLKNMK